LGQTTWEGVLNPERQLAVSGAALSNSAVATDISPAPQLTLAADAISKGGEVLKCYAAGRLTTPGAAVPTLALGVYWGGVAGVALGTNAAVAPVISAAAWLWSLETVTVFRVPGASGTFSAWTTGVLWLPATVSTFQAAYTIPGTAPAAVTTGDTTVARALTIGATWGSAVAGTTVQCDEFLADLKN
jgi:hypothetical protein